MRVRETEFKFLLTVAEYQLLLDKLGQPERTRHFVNRYFGLEQASPRKDWVLRLRIEAEHQELTLKIGREIEPGVFDALEINENVASCLPEDWENSAPLRAFREQISDRELLLQGEVSNQRSVFAAPIALGEYWELDKSSYPGNEEHYELEIELAFEGGDSLKQSREMLMAWFEEQGLSPKPSQKTKYARFLETLAS